MDNREKLLHAAGRIYAEVGFRGATTRRIADEAGVNEVTLFRLFGSKAQLIAEAISSQNPMGEASLPRVPVDPWKELNAWCGAHAVALRAMRATIRKTMADIDEHPEMGPHLCREKTPHFNGLVAYTRRLVALHTSSSDAEADVEAACSMLFSALFMDAMGREIVPDVYPQPEDEATARYVRIFLRALGIAAGPSRAGPVMAGRSPGVRRVATTPSMKPARKPA